MASKTSEYLPFEVVRDALNALTEVSDWFLSYVMYIELLQKNLTGADAVRRYMAVLQAHVDRLREHIAAVEQLIGHREQLQLEMRFREEHCLELQIFLNLHEQYEAALRHTIAVMVDIRRRCLPAKVSRSDSGEYVLA